MSVFSFLQSVPVATAFASSEGTDSQQTKQRECVDEAVRRRRDAERLGRGGARRLPLESSLTILAQVDCSCAQKFRQSSSSLHALYAYRLLPILH